MSSYLWYGIAACGEIAGCFAYWAWLRGQKSAWWVVPGTAALILFALALTRIDSSHAGRAFAAYGGIYIASSLVWLAVVEGVKPDRWDLAGAGCCLIGTALILFGPRAG